MVPETVRRHTNPRVVIISRIKVGGRIMVQLPLVLRSPIFHILNAARVMTLRSEDRRGGIEPSQPLNLSVLVGHLVTETPQLLLRLFPESRLLGVDLVHLLAQAISFDPSPDAAIEDLPQWEDVHRLTLVLRTTGPSAIMFLTWAFTRGHLIARRVSLPFSLRGRRNRHVSHGYVEVENSDRTAVDVFLLLHSTPGL